jgi:hypothetical protein
MDGDDNKPFTPVSLAAFESRFSFFASARSVDHLNRHAQ